MASSNATTGLEKPPASSYATITASKSVLVAITTEADEEFDAFLEENPGKLFACYVTYPSSYSPMQDSIVEGIRDTITKNNSKFLDEGLFWSEFKGGTPARRDVHRILVAFTHEEDQAAFRSLMQVMFKDPQGVWLHAQIGQERLSYEDILGSSGDKGQKVYMVLKKMPDSFTVTQIEKFFTDFVWKSKGFTHPFLGSIDKITWFWHKSGFMQAIDDDKYIELVSADDSREAWKCTLCIVAGKGFFGCYRHIGCDAHKQALSDEA
ncbi:hypothetical protein KFL_015840010, partial [Klebsormidium nitens]